jgi:hypothetical protein
MEGDNVANLISDTIDWEKSNKPREYYKDGVFDYALKFERPTSLVVHGRAYGSAIHTESSVADLHIYINGVKYSAHDNNFSNYRLDVTQQVTLLAGTQVSVSMRRSNGSASEDLSNTWLKISAKPY